MNNEDNKYLQEIMNMKDDDVKKALREEFRREYGKEIRMLTERIEKLETKLSSATKGK